MGVDAGLFHFGPPAQGQICAKILKSGTNVPTVVDNLERDGLVRRVRDENDRRVQVVHLTDLGRDLIDRAFPVHAARITALVSALDPDEQATLSGVAGRLPLTLRMRTHHQPTTMNALELHVHRWEPAAAETSGTLLLLHGTGGDEHDLLPLARLVAPGAALLSVRGNVLEHGAPRFFRRLAEGVFDLDDLHRRTGELADFLDAACAHYGIAPDRLFALGFSNGANIAASLLLSRPAALAGGVLLRAMVPFEPAPPPDLSGRAVLLSQGRTDPLIAAAGAERLDAILREAGAEVELTWQHARHGLVQGDVSAAQGWLARHIGT